MPPSQRHRVHRFRLCGQRFTHRSLHPLRTSCANSPNRSVRAVETGARCSVCRSQESREDHRLHRQHSGPSHRMPAHPTQLNPIQQREEKSLEMLKRLSKVWGLC
ncbi:hypothetical protein GBAR_LOCUS13908 [Geodia barretti]|uniref:Uncharacterized protein n=1 Tax=Geodia barretti TaxID=519541 RepID=A0AA35S7A2_GEOBA|nr:hypothetical protein GBAR_LOCUS13908 [Geodia barretti]